MPPLGDIASREYVLTDGRTTHGRTAERQTCKHKPLTACCCWRRLISGERRDVIVFICFFRLNIGLQYQRSNVQQTKLLLREDSHQGEKKFHRKHQSPVTRSNCATGLGAYFELGTPESWSCLPRVLFLSFTVLLLPGRMGVLNPRQEQLVESTICQGKSGPNSDPDYSKHLIGTSLSTDTYMIKFS